MMACVTGDTHGGKRKKTVERLQKSRPTG